MILSSQPKADLAGTNIKMELYMAAWSSSALWHDTIMIQIFTQPTSVSNSHSGVSMLHGFESSSHNKQTNATIIKRPTICVLKPTFSRTCLSKMFLLIIDWVCVSCNNIYSSITAHAHLQKVQTSIGLNNFDYFVKIRKSWNFWQLHLTISGTTGKIRVETDCICLSGGWSKPAKSHGWTGVNIGLFCNITSRNIWEYLRIFGTARASLDRADWRPAWVWLALDWSSDRRLRGRETAPDPPKHPR